MKDLQGFNLSAGSLVRLPKDCDAHLILARLRPSTFTYYWSADPGEPSAIVEYGIKSSQSKLTPPPPGVMQQTQTKLKTSEFSIIRNSIAPTPQKLKIFFVYIHNLTTI